MEHDEKEFEEEQRRESTQSEFDEIPPEDMLDEPKPQKKPWYVRPPFLIGGVIIAAMLIGVLKTMGTPKHHAQVHVQQPMPQVDSQQGFHVQPPVQGQGGIPGGAPQFAAPACVNGLISESPQGVRLVCRNGKWSSDPSLSSAPVAPSFPGSNPSGPFPIASSAEVVPNAGQGQSGADAKIGTIQKQIEDLETRVSKLEEGAASRKVAPARHTGRVKKHSRGRRRIAQRRHDVAERKAAPIPDMHYSLQAVIPGQAWVNTGSGLIAVNVGDRLPNGAKITAIDADANVVHTTLGDIRFSDSP